MRLTSELREQYISKVIKEIESITGLIVPGEMLHYNSYDKKAKMVEVPIEFNCSCIAVDSDDTTLGEMIRLNNHRYFHTQLAYDKYNRVYHWGENSIFLLKQDAFDKLKSIVNLETKIPSIEEWNKFVKVKQDYKDKKLAALNHKNKMTLDFDGSISLKEIEQRFGPDLKLVYHKTKLSFHKWYRSWRGALRIYTYPTYELKLKPAVENQVHSDNLYNKAEYEAEMIRLGLPL